MKIALFTKDLALGRLVQSTMAGENVESTQYADEVELARALHREDYDAIVFDATAGINELHPVLARRACFGGCRAPLVAIGHFPAPEDLLAALIAGADEIVLLPIDPRELKLRVLLAMQRFGSHSNFSVKTQRDDAELVVGEYRLRRHDGSIIVAGHAVRLTAREFAIAWMLFSQQGNYVTRRAIAAAVWGSSAEIAGRTIEQHIYKLRKKLGLYGAHGIVLRTMYAHGYRIEPVLEKSVRLEPQATLMHKKRYSKADIFKLRASISDTQPRSPKRKKCAKLDGCSYG